MKIRRLTNRDCLAILSSFTLAEVLVAVLIVSIAVVSLYTGVSSGFGLVKLAREDLRATQIMLEKVETIRLYNWDQATTNYIPSSFTNYYDPQSGPGSQGPQFHGTLTIEPIDPSQFRSSYSNEMRRITVRLDWQTGGIQRSRQFSSFIARNGLQNYIY